MERTIEQIDLELTNLRLQVAEEKKLKNTIKELSRQILQRQSAVMTCKSDFLTEQADVDALENLSFTSFFAAIHGNKEERLEKERREALTAKAFYDAACFDLEDLKRRLECANVRIAELVGSKNKLSELLVEKTKLMFAMAGGSAESLLELEDAISACIAQQKELSEAIEAGEHAISALQTMIATLESAAGMGMWDMIGGGMFTTMLKHEKLDEVRGHADTVRRAMSYFQTELSDVSFLEIPDLQLSEFTVFADYFCDNIFVDMFVQNQINATQDNANKTLEGIEELVEELSAQLEESKMDQQDLEEEREELLAE